MNKHAADGCSACQAGVDQGGVSVCVSPSVDFIDFIDYADCEDFVDSREDWN